MARTVRAPRSNRLTTYFHIGGESFSHHTCPCSLGSPRDHGSGGEYSQPPATVPELRPSSPVRRGRPGGNPRACWLSTLAPPASGGGGNGAYAWQTPPVQYQSSGWMSQMMSLRLKPCSLTV